jgi:TPR repeat protein
MKQPIKITRVTIITGCLLTIACGLALVFYLRANRPASTAVMAMARGQYTLASRFYSADALEGNPAAMNSLGNLYYLGLGIEKNYRRAAELYHQAAAEGHAAAQLNLGHLYKQGLGVNTNHLRAFGWYNMSNIHGNPQAERHLGLVVSEFAITANQIAVASEKWAHLEYLLSEDL